MKKTLIIILLSVALVGCTTMGNVAITEPSNFIALKTGQTARDSVHGKFGQPDDVIEQGQKKVWRYIQVKTSPEPATFVLSVLIWPLVFIQQTDYAITQTDFSFDTEGLLFDVSTRKGERQMGIFGAFDSMSDENKAANKLSLDRIKGEMEVNKLPFDQQKAERTQRFFAI